MFQIKICGIVTPEDARDAGRAGVEAVGLNFCADSPRYLDANTARIVIAAVPAEVAKVGVFVNLPLPDVAQAFDTLSLDYIQLHGDESPEFVANVAPRPVVRAFRMNADGWRPIVDYVAQCRMLGCLPAALLIDAHRPGMYGGTGQTVDWTLVRQRPPELASLPIILAGGLTPDNVAQAIETARPWGVDTASGVESMPGIKDVGKMGKFVAESRAAFAS